MTNEAEAERRGAWEGATTAEHGAGRDRERGGGGGHMRGAGRVPCDAGRVGAGGCCVIHWDENQWAKISKLLYHGEYLSLIS